MKRTWFYVAFAIVALSLTFVHAQLEDSGAQLQQTIDNVSQGVDKTRDVIDNQKYSFLGEQWKEFLLQNSFIAPVHQFFQKIDIVFLIVLGRHYELSLTLFFAFLLWLFTLIWSSQAAKAFFRNGFICFAVGLGFTVLIAQMQLFNKLSEAAFKVMFYQTSAIWSFIIFIFLIVALVVYFYLGRLLGKYMKNLKELEEKNTLKREVSLEKTYRESSSKASS